MIALARTYRPKRFAELVAQDHVAAALRGAVAGGRVAHGYLFAGPRGVGKTTAARVLAMALNCPDRAEGEPCGKCDSCTRIWVGAANLDVVELDAASNRGVDDARDLRERAMYAASADGRHKVYIVDEAHMLTREAWNALLKVLEEPPSGVVFVFATTDAQKIAQAAAPVLSRVQRFDFRRIGPLAIAQRLREVVTAEKLAADDDALRLIAKSADGGMRDGLSLLDQVLSFGEGPVTAQRVRDVLGLIADDLYGDLLRVIGTRDARGAFTLVERLLEAGADLGEFVAGAGDTLRAVLLAGLGGAPEGMTEGLQALVRDAATRFAPGDVVRLLAILSESEPSIRHSGNSRLAVELLLLRWAMLDRTVDLATVLDALGKSEKGEEGSGKRSDSPPQLRDAAPISATPFPLPPSPASPAEKSSLTVDRLRSLWPEIVSRSRSISPMLPTLLGDTEVASVAGGTVTIRVQGASAGHAEGIERKQEALARLIAEYATEPVRVVVTGGGSGKAGDAGEPAPRPARLNEQSANAERLKVLRGKDPTLNAAVDALDLELLE
jgi:DNA polymerase-3 subunit gamma/tau